MVYNTPSFTKSTFTCIVSVHQDCVPGTGRGTERDEVVPVLKGLFVQVWKEDSNEEKFRRLSCRSEALNVPRQKQGGAARFAHRTLLIQVSASVFMSLINNCKKNDS